MRGLPGELVVSDEKEVGGEPRAFHVGSRRSGSRGAILRAAPGVESATILDTRMCR